jgi:putative aldouronate transport system permease protein
VSRYYSSVGGRVFDALNYAILIVLCILMLYPFWYVLVASFSAPHVVAVARGSLLWPQGWTSAAYKRVFENPIIGIAYFNTIFYVVMGTAINIVMTALAAYSLSRRHLWGRLIIMRLIVFTMFFSGGLIPLYLLVKAMGLLNTRWPLLLHNAIITFNFIIMRTGFAQMPDSLEESAKLDGCNDFVILLRIYFPLAMPIVAVMLLYYGVYHWNSWFWAMVYLRERNLYPLQLILREILIANDMSSMMSSSDLGRDEEMIAITIQYATIIITMAPVTVLYPFLQRYFVKGMLLGSIKE